MIDSTTCGEFGDVMLGMNVIGETDTEQSEAQAKRRMCGAENEWGQ
jgi:hypothetical protein